MIIFHYENDCHNMSMANNITNPYFNNEQYDDNKFLCLIFL